MDLYFGFVFLRHPTLLYILLVQQSPIFEYGMHNMQWSAAYS